MKISWGNAIRLLFLSVVVGGCTSLKTHVVKGAPTSVPTEEREGIIYRLPLQAAKVTLSVSGAKRTVTVVPSDPYPDMSQAYVAKYRRSQLTNNTLSLTVNKSGLLSGKVGAVVSPLIGDLLKSIANTVPQLHKSIAENIGNKCAADGDYVWFWEPRAVPHDSLGHRITTHASEVDPIEDAQLTVESEMALCGMKVDSTLLGMSSSSTSASLPTSEKDFYGIFYRQTLPYDITVMNGSVMQSFLTLMVTRQSPVEFISLQKSFFAKNDFALTFDNGSPTEYAQTIDSEWAGALSLPADLISKYFAAVGAVFTSRKSAMDNESSYITALTKLQSDQAKLNLCMTAVRTGIQTSIATACGN